MLRKENSIPNFVKEFKEEFFSYTLNLDEESAQNLLKSEVELTDDQNRILDEIIQTCRSLRVQGVDQNDPDYMVYFRLRETILNNKTHVLNKWREQCGGSLPKIENQDSLINTFQILGVESYPAFLLKERKKGHFLRGISISHQHTLGKSIKEQIVEDEKLTLLFNVKGSSDMDTYCSYKVSTGHASSIQLATIVDLILLNSYHLMILEGQDNIASYLECIETNVNLLREIAVSKKANVPVYFGYSNVAFPENTSIEIPQGQLTSFDEKILNILPQSAKPSVTEGVQSAFVFKGNYSYAFEFQEKERHGKIKWPKELKQSWSKLEQIDEDLKLALKLSCKRTPAVSLGRQWTIIFDPLNHGVNLSWNSNRNTPTPYHKCSKDEIINIKKWCEKIHETDDSKIRLAIRKTISAISDRQNPIDGFIDGIVAWENLFGANAELSFRISSAISCLLEKDKAKRKELYKKLKKAYDTRSTIVHGVKEINYEKAVEFRDFAVEISLACFSELYENQPELINLSDRSLTILLEHE